MRDRKAVAVDDLAALQAAALGRHSALHRIGLAYRLFWLSVWAGLTIAGMYTPLGFGLVLFSLGLFNYVALLAFRMDNAFMRLPDETPARDAAPASLPSFSIIFPLKHEPEVIHDTIRCIAALDYPASLRQVIVTVEATDEVTLRSLEGIELPEGFSLLRIPESPPYTKGRALLHALRHATGDYLTVYDAESRPEPRQLLEAARVLTHAAGPLCVQARVRISNADTNWLTRNFAGEYHEWYDRHLRCLSQEGRPFGLGGNSFFLSRRELEAAGAWDPFNVTEDAELSVRLIRRGVRLQLLDSHTDETCPDTMGNWINQRVRWNKGLFVTQLVHLVPTLFERPFGRGGWFHFWLRMLCGSLLPFFNLYTALFLLFSGLPYPLVMAYSLVLWGLLAFSVLSAWIINADTYRRLGIRQGPFTALADSLAYLLIHFVAGFKAYAEYFSSPLRWNKTDHGVAEPPASALVAAQDSGRLTRDVPEHSGTPVMTDAAR